MLFPNGTEGAPRVKDTANQGFALFSLGIGYGFCGQPGRALPFIRRAVELLERTGQTQNLAPVLHCLCYLMCVTGALHQAEADGCRALARSRRDKAVYECGVALEFLGLVRAARGLANACVALQRSLTIFIEQGEKQSEGVVTRFLAQSVLWSGDAAAARGLADRAWTLAGIERVEGDFIRTARIQGEAALALGDLDSADERLHHAIMRARAVNLVEEELPALTALATLHHRRGNTARARELLEEVWDAAERGPFPLLHADARNVLAEIEIAEGNLPAAIAAATQAYKLAWCDGPPFAYDYGLRTARALLQRLGAPEPDMPPFDPSKHEPIEEIPIEVDDDDAQAT